jgi:hypothetical protein
MAETKGKLDAVETARIAAVAAETAASSFDDVERIGIKPDMEFDEAGKAEHVLVHLLNEANLREDIVMTVGQLQSLIAQATILLEG